jgi:hypothetical protein
MRITSAFVAAAALAGCGDSPSAAPSAAASGPVPSVLAPGSAEVISSAEVEDETSTRPVELLKLVFAADVKDKEPSGQLQVAKPGQKVFAHLTVRNLSNHPRKVKLNFSVAGEKRTQVELFVGESWSWRTWAYNTLLAKDAGKKLELEVTDDEGHPLFEGALPIAAK